MKVDFSKLLGSLSTPDHDHVWQTAWADLVVIRGSVLRYWFPILVLVVAVESIVGFVLVDASDLDGAVLILLVVLAAGGLALVATTVGFLALLVAAPFRQRNRARRSLEVTLDRVQLASLRASAVDNANALSKLADSTPEQQFAAYDAHRRNLEYLLGETSKVLSGTTVDAKEYVSRAIPKTVDGLRDEFVRLAQGLGRYTDVANEVGRDIGCEFHR